MEWRIFSNCIKLSLLGIINHQAISLRKNIEIRGSSLLKFTPYFSSLLEPRQSSVHYDVLAQKTRMPWKTTKLIAE
jgi:hypothetical protein